MDAPNAARAYRAASLDNAPPIKIVRMLYAGALRFLERARRATPGSPEHAHWLGRSDSIVKELRCSLEHSHDPRLSADLEHLYLFVEDQICAAQIHGRVAALDDAERVLRTLESAWQGIGSGASEDAA